MDITRLIWAICGGGKGKKDRRYEPDTASKRPKVRRQVTQMSELYRKESLEEGQPSPWAEEFRIGGGVGKS